MIQVYCARCNQELIQVGAIIISPPIKFDEVTKIHLCISCWMKFLEWMDEK